MKREERKRRGKTEEGEEKKRKGKKRVAGRKNKEKQPLFFSFLFSSVFVFEGKQRNRGKNTRR